MKTLYIDCAMGAAGDMLTAALLELVENKDDFINRLNSLGLPGVKYEIQRVKRCGISGNLVSVKINGEEEGTGDGHDSSNHHHEHHALADIEHIVRDHLNVCEDAKKDIIKVFSLIAQAESEVHGERVEMIHFHEVGTMDAIADVAAVCLLINEIAPDKIMSSAINTGSGFVKCAHGVLPVPAPATAYLLRDVPIYQGEIKSELCTPTGAALIKYFADEFGSMPVMQTHAIGYGMGKKEFETANCVRAFLGEEEDIPPSITCLLCNLDDMTPEAIGFATETLMREGALDVYTINVGMKKNRPGVLLCAMCENAEKNKMVELIFKHTTTLGIREHIAKRYILNRFVETLLTEFGNVRKKISTGYGVSREKFEYDDISRIARENEISLRDVENMLK